MKALLVFADYLEDAQAVNLTHNAEIHQAILHIELGRAVPAAAVKAAIGHHQDENILIQYPAVIQYNMCLKKVEMRARMYAPLPVTRGNRL